MRRSAVRYRTDYYGGTGARRPLGAKFQGGGIFGIRYGR